MRNRLSLRLRLLLAIGAISLVALGLADVVVYGSLGSYLYRQVDDTLLSSHRAVESTADDPDAATSDGSVFVPPASPPGGRDELPGVPGPSGASAFCAVGRETAPGMFIEVRDSKDQVVTGPAGREECPAFQPGSTSYSPELPSVIGGFVRSSSDPRELATYFTAVSTSANGPAFRVRASMLGNGETLIIATPVSGVTRTLSQLLLVELLVTAGALLTAGVLGLWLVRVGLRPLRDVERTADAIAGGDLVHRVPDANRRTEVGHLATAFNLMLERIERLVTELRASESRLRRFVGDASHELRTPIAAISAYAQLFKEGASARPEDLERTMIGIERESTRMASLVEDLLTLAKLDEHRLLMVEPVELVGLVMDATETARLVGPDWPISFSADEAVEVIGDYGALRQVVDNLLANVRSHTPAGTPTSITVGRVDHVAFVEVADEGPGITAEQAAVIFERFFRSDPSRSRETGGAGLGLAIVTSIVQAHGGDVVAEPRRGGGAVFRVTLPAVDGDAEDFAAD